jgi:hypothetical protein
VHIEGTYSATLTTETSNQHFVVFFQEIQATVILSNWKSTKSASDQQRDASERTGTKAVTFLPFLIN